MQRPNVCIPTLAVGILVCAGAALSQDPPDRTKPRPATQPSAVGGPESAMSVLKSLEGSWTVSMRSTSTGDMDSDSASAQRITGQATRTWILDKSVLKEDVRVLSGGDSEMDRSPAKNPDSDPGRGGPSAPQAAGVEPGFEGLGLFSIDGASNQISHVWADSQSKGMIFCLGSYDERTRTITFTGQAGELDHDAHSGKPGSSLDPADRDKEAKRPTDAPPRDSARPTGEGAAATGTHPVVTLRIVNENEHVVTLSHAGATRGQESYEITYRRSAGRDVTPPSDRPGSQPKPPPPAPKVPSER